MNDEIISKSDINFEKKNKFLVCPKCNKEILSFEIQSMDDEIAIIYYCSQRKKKVITKLNEFINKLNAIKTENQLGQCCLHPLNKSTIYCGMCQKFHCEKCLRCLSVMEIQYPKFNFEMNFSCPEHSLKLNRYCQTCNQCFCDECQNKHKKHKTFVSKMESNDAIKISNEIQTRLEKIEERKKLILPFVEGFKKMEKHFDEEIKTLKNLVEFYNKLAGTKLKLGEYSNYSTNHYLNFKNFNRIININPYNDWIIENFIANIQLFHGLKFFDKIDKSVKKEHFIEEMKTVQVTIYNYCLVCIIFLIIFSQ